ncbi:ROK family protein [Candidatus Woesearchaeota archaeon]|nr:ROK family protein [Candidatus Woesearchaeota archaeon]
MRLGVDVGGTKIEGALVSDKFKIVKSIRKPTEASKGKEVVINNILSVIKALDSEDIPFIGLSIASIISREGLMKCSPNLSCLDGVNIVKELEKHTNKEVLPENDANCFVLAEHKLGAARGYETVVGIILGTGIGGGIIINRELYRGKNGDAGEFGYMIIIEGKSFEQLCSGPSIVKRYTDAGGKIEHPDPKKIFASKEYVARQIVEDTYKYLRIGIVNIIKSLGPDIIVIGGGLSNLPIYPRLNTEIKRHLPESMAKNVKIVKNRLGDCSGVIGAAFLRI